VDHERLTRWAVAGAVVALASGCQTQALPTPIFDGPEWSDVLQPDQGGPFWSPVAFVANTRDGSITPLDLRHGTAVSDQHGAPFLPPRRVATGNTRQLGQIAAWVPAEDRVTVFAADLAHGVLVQAPYLRGLDSTGEPIPVVPEAGEVVFEDVDGSGDSADVVGLQMRYGFTTTEEWTLTYDGSEWIAVGTRSGRQSTGLRFGQTWLSDNRELELTIRGSASAGDTLRFTTDTLLVEHDVGGLVMGLTRVPDEDLLVLGVWDPVASQGDLVLWDMYGEVELGRIALADVLTGAGASGVGAQPWRFAWDDESYSSVALGEDLAEDGLPPRLFVGDARLPVVWDIELDLAFPASSSVESISVPAPVNALAVVAESDDPRSYREGYHNLMVAPIDGTRVDLYDLIDERWIDVNPRDGVVGGLDLRSPIVGLSALPAPVLLFQEANSGARVEKKGVAVSTLDGALALIEGDSGCMATDGQGARVLYDTGAYQLEYVDRGNLSNPVLFTDPDTARSVVGSECGGIARNETWTLVYDGLLGGWTVEGSVSGPQEAVAYEDERYVTDDGGISFLILAGTQPTTDGDIFVFTVDDGVLEVTSVPVESGEFELPFDLPGPPLAFLLDSGPSGGGWDKDRTKVNILMPVTNSDIAIRQRVQGWFTEFVFD
jgi:hypothetical protein